MFINQWKALPIKETQQLYYTIQPLKIEENQGFYYVHLDCIINIFVATMSEYYKSSEGSFRANWFTILTGIFFLVVTQLYTLYYITKLINAEYVSFISIGIHLFYVFAGYTVAYSSAWWMIRNTYKSRQEVKSPIVQSVIVYFLLSVVGYFLLLNYLPDTFEEVEYLPLIYIGASLVLVALVVWRARKELNVRWAEIDGEMSRVKEFIDSELSGVRNKRQSIGDAVRNLHDKGYKDYYEEYATKVFKQAYYELSDEDKLADFQIFLRKKQYIEPRMVNNIMYFPAHFYVPVRPTNTPKP